MKTFIFQLQNGFSATSNANFANIFIFSDSSSTKDHSGCTFNKILPLLKEIEIAPRKCSYNFKTYLTVIYGTYRLLIYNSFCCSIKTHHRIDILIFSLILIKIQHKLQHPGPSPSGGNFKGTAHL